MSNFVSAVGSVPVNFSSNSFAPMRKSVYIDGKEYPVRKVPDNNPTRTSVAPIMKECIFVNGKRYDVKTTNNPLTCDGNCQVVVVDGKKYNVRVH